MIVNSHNLKSFLKVRKIQYDELMLLNTAVKYDI